MTAPQPTEPTIRAYRQLAAGLSTPSLTELAGSYDAEFVGPAWLRRSAGPGLALTGAPGWIGKRFDADGRGVNLFRRRGQESERIVMHVKTRASRIDGKPVLTAGYDATAPLAWRPIVDELRVLDKDTILGMMGLELAGLRRITLPFLLHRR